MKIFALLALTFWLVFAAINTSQAASPELSASARAAYDKLHQTEIFALGGVGIAGATSQGETAFREVQKDPNAVAAFVALLDDEMTPRAGQLYALLGLKEAKDTQFEERLPDFLADESTVTQFRGCIMMPVKVKEIAARFVDKK